MWLYIMAKIAVLAVDQINTNVEVGQYQKQSHINATSAVVVDIGLNLRNIQNTKLQDLGRSQIKRKCLTNCGMDRCGIFPDKCINLI